MDYLWWFVPVITSPMLIALIATLHVFISHYAVGGGVFLAWELGNAYKNKDEEYVAYLHSHAKFFVLLTVVLGAITGVGIWWTIGLASPLATEMLINIFVFGWATEWVFFVVELVAAFIFLYLWGKMPRRKHLAIGWIYAISALISLNLICGILGFMLHPSPEWMVMTDGGTSGANFFAAFLNSQYLPQSLARAGAALVLAAVYVLFHASVTLKEDKIRLRNMIAERAGMFSVFGMILAVVGVYWAYSNLPESAQMSLSRAPVLNIFFAAGVAAGAGLMLMLLMLTRNPRWLSPVAGIGMLGMVLAAFTCAEFTREAVRKPYVIYDVVLSNQIRTHDVPRVQKEGVLGGGYWTRHHMGAKFPYLINADGTLSLDRVRKEDREAVGHVIFMHHCNDCHAEGYGYSGLTPLAVSRSRAEKLHFIKNLDGMIYNMPPWCGTDREAELLTDYLEKIAAKYPARKVRMKPVDGDISGLDLDDDYENFYGEDDFDPSE